MSRNKTERQMSLLLCLLGTRRFLTVHEIRETVPGYESNSEEAFRRMFERDKDELRELGIPLETGETGDDEVGYRIRSQAYALPDISLTADEAAAVGLAARLWSSAPLAGTAGRALLKLRAAGMEPSEAPAGLDPRIEALEPGFAEAWRAVRDKRAVRFPYRSGRATEVEQREVEPWGLVNWHGRWYLVGHDRAREASRVFRLSRIEGDVEAIGAPGVVVRPADLDLRDTVAQLAEPPAKQVATLRMRVGTCGGLRYDVRSVVSDGMGWETLEVGFSGVGRFAGRVAEYGSDVVALQPEELRAAVVRHLKQVLAA